MLTKLRVRCSFSYWWCRILVDFRKWPPHYHVLFCFCCFYSLYSPLYSILAELLDDIRLHHGGGGGWWYFRICWLIGPMILPFHKQEHHIHNPALVYIHTVYIQAGDSLFMLLQPSSTPPQVSFLLYVLHFMKITS